MTTRKWLAIGAVGLIVVLGLVLAAGFVVDVGSQQSSDHRPTSYRGADSGGVGLTASGGDAAGDVARQDAPTEEQRATPAPPEADDSVPDVQSRARIKNGEVVLEVADFDASRTALTEQVRQHGGYVSDVRQRQHRKGNRTWSTGEITLRVPAENFSALRNDAKGSGVVLREEVSTRDVTEQLVDLNARIENLQRQRDQLRTLYDRANETEELLAIQDQLSDVQGEIERLQAQRQSLRQQISYSTLTVEFREPEPGELQIDYPAYHERPLVEAFLSSVNGVIVLLQSAIVTAAYALPYLVVLSVLSTPVWLWRRRQS
jgi:hypothetical protein